MVNRVASDDWVRLHLISPRLYDKILAEKLGPHSTPADIPDMADRMKAAMRQVDEKISAVLSRVGLSLGKLIDLRDEAWAAEDAAIEADGAPVGEDQTPRHWRDRHKEWDPSYDRPRSRKMVAAIVELYLRGLAPGEIDCILSLPPGWVAATLKSKRIPPGGREVVQAHLAGMSVAEISRVTGVPQSSATRILGGIRETTRGAEQRRTARERAQTIVRLAEKGLTYRQISERLGCSLDIVKNTLRRDRRHRYGGRGPAE